MVEWYTNCLKSEIDVNLLQNKLNWKEFLYALRIDFSLQLAASVLTFPL